MSRRPAAAGADRTEQNRATLKQLVKLESNKSCADCKRNKHPRWASWNLGVFVCIRCSGIHRGMGTHVSRVKSVDLDSWTDEQLQSMLRWGNARANKYWEHKLAEGHVPNESKIENFIRTKYDSKRWVMDGPMPDPATLDVSGADDDMPLKMVQERARSGSGAAAQRNGSGPAQVRPQQIDLFGDDPAPAASPSRPQIAEPRSTSQPAQAKAPPAPPKQSKPGEGLLGLDFFGGASTQPARPSSTGPSGSGLPGRTDLKQSILSLYASKPAAPPQTSPNASAFSGMQSPPLQSPQQTNAQALGGLDDAFGSLSFSSPQQGQPKASPFSDFMSPAPQNQQPSVKSPLSGGGFFDAKPAPSSKPMSPPFSQPITSSRKESFGNDFGDFSSAASPVTTMKSPPVASSSMGDLFDLSTPAPPPPPKPAAASQPPPPVSKQPPPINYSAFNLSQTTPASPPPPKAAPSQTSTMPNLSGLGNMDAWGSNDAWATPDPAPASNPAHAPAKAAPMQSSSNAFKPQAQVNAFDGGWGDEPAKPASSSFGMSSPGGFGSSSAGGFSSNPTTTSAGGFSVQQDEEFGGWSHASPITAAPPSTSASTSTSKPSGGLGNTDDLFGNVWE